MTLADFGFGPQQNTAQRSLDVARRRGTYTVRPSLAAFDLKSRIIRAAISAATIGIGTVLVVSGKTILGVSGPGGALIVPMGVYMIMAGLFWLYMLLRRPPELVVDTPNRAFHIIKPSLLGHARARETVRFEEVARIEMVDRVRGYDMSADANGWTLARLEVIWQGDRVTPMMTGEIGEIEALLGQLRREVGMA
jgi:hypothetical protein